MKIRILKHIIILLTFSISLIASEYKNELFSEDEKLWIQKNKKVTIATSNNFGHFIYKNNDKLEGFTIELINKISKISGLEIEIKDSSWVETYTSFKNGNVDMIADISHTKDREQFTLFTKPYYSIPTFVFGLKKNTSYKNNDSLIGKKIAVLKHTYYIEILQEQGLEIYEVNNEIEQIEAIVNGKADFFLGSITPTYKIVDSALLEKIEVKEEYTKVPKEDLRFGVYSTKKTLYSIIKKSLSLITQNEIKLLMDKWRFNFQNNEYKVVEKKTINDLNLTHKEKNYLKDKNTFNVCLQHDIYPYDGFKDGKHIGIMADIYKIITEKIKIKLNIINSTTHTELDENVKSGKCDLVSVISKKQDRFKNVFPTDSFINANFVLVGNLKKIFRSGNYFDINGTILVSSKWEKQYLEFINPNLNVQYNEDFDYVINKVIQDDNYSTIFLDQVAEYKIQKYGFGKLKIIGYMDIELEGSIGVIESEPILLDILNKVIPTISNDKIIEIKRKYQTTRYHEKTDYKLLIEIVIISLIIVFSLLLLNVILQKNYKKINKILNSTIEAVVILENNEIIEVNDSFVDMFGYKYTNEVKNKEISIFLSKAIDISYVQKENKNPFELVVKKKDNSEFTVLFKRTYISDKKSIITMVDINNLKLVQNELNFINQNLEEKIQEEIKKNEFQQAILLNQSRLAQMGELINMIAHQWRQPLNNISILFQTVKLKYQMNKIDDIFIDEFHSDSKRQINFMSQTIDDFMNFFKPEKEKTYFNISDNILNVKKLINPIFEKNNINFSIIGNEEINLLGFPNEFGQVILNILNNSKDALIENNPENKFIKVTIDENKYGTKITINDNAGGVNIDFIDKIFDPYFSTKSEKNGTGVGLYMCKVIIEEHMNGKISVANNNYGLLTTLYFNKSVESKS